jgi:hypothetical protein
MGFHYVLIYQQFNLQKFFTYIEGISVCVGVVSIVILFYQNIYLSSDFDSRNWHACRIKLSLSSFFSTFFHKA